MQHEKTKAGSKGGMHDERNEAGSGGCHPRIPVCLTYGARDTYRSLHGRETARSCRSRGCATLFPGNSGAWNHDLRPTW